MLQIQYSLGETDENHEISNKIPHPVIYSKYLLLSHLVSDFHNIDLSCGRSRICNFEFILQTISWTLEHVWCNHCLVILVSVDSTALSLFLSVLCAGYVAQKYWPFWINSWRILTISVQEYSLISTVDKLSVDLQRY